MTNQDKPGLRHQIGSFLWSGLLVMLAPAITVWLLKLVYGILNDALGPVVSFFVRLTIPHAWLGPFGNGDIPGLALLVTLLFLILVGWVARSPFGKKLLTTVLDTIFDKVPGVRSVYAAIRTTVETLADPKKREFKKAVWIPAFGKGRALVLVTGESKDETTGQKLYTVWWPHSPNPMSGMIMTFPDDDVVESKLDYQQAMEIYVSLGVKMPLSLRLTSAVASAILKVLPEPGELKDS
jgi:uncharacterized membrane protein